MTERLFFHLTLSKSDGEALQALLLQEMQERTQKGKESNPSLTNIVDMLADRL